MDTQGRGVESEVESHADGDVGRNGRRYLSPPRVLARSFRMTRDNWKMKHQAVQEKLEQERQLSADRGRSREKWKQKFESASGARWWLLRMGLYALREPLEQASDWVYIIDHSIQIGTLKLCLMSPGLRPKARYMNLASLLRWSRRILELLARGAAGGSVTERTKARYGWMEDYRAVLSEWARWEDTVRSSVEFIRVHGFFQDCDVELA